MVNNSIDTNPGDVRWTRRDSCVRLGRVPAMQKGEVCWVFFAEEWRASTVKSRLPGGVYRCSLNSPVLGCHEIIACANNYGGYVE